MKNRLFEDNGLCAEYDMEIVTGFCLREKKSLAFQ